MPSDKDSDVQELRRVFALQSSQQWLNKNSTAEQRIEKLEKLKATIQRRESEVHDALYADLRKAPAAVQGELQTTYTELDDARHRARITYESRGKVLLFGPWNFPFNLIFLPLTAIVAAGNCAIVKPNEMSPATSALCARIIREVFDEADVAALEGGVDLANRLLDLPFDHIFFTGSPAVGKVVMGAAAKHLASVTLELGGKNPVIVDRTVDIATTAARVAVYRAMNSGQLCLCPGMVWVPEECRQQFLHALEATFASRFYVDGKLNPDAIGKIVDQRNFDRVAGYIADAREQGATLVCGGGVEPELRAVHPTVLVDVPGNARISDEEVFGPILCVYTYQDVEEVFAVLHRRPKPLALYVFSTDEDFVDKVLRNTSSGGVTVNDCLMHCVEHRLPFGGVNHSGIGRYHGVHGFRELSHERAVLVAP